MKRQNIFVLNALPARQSGFSLAEVLVAVLIGLIATLVMMQIYALSEGYKRTTTSGADAQTNGVVALYQVERDLRQAGYGLAPNGEDFNKVSGVLEKGILTLCSTVRAYNGTRAPTNFSYTNSTFAPVVINPAGYPVGDTGTDLIMVNYSGSGGLVGTGIDIVTMGGTVEPGGDVPDYQAVSSRAGFNQGDMFIAVPPAGTGLDCSIGEITNLPTTTQATAQCPAGWVNDQGNILTHNNVQYRSVYFTNSDGSCGTVQAVWNQPGGIGVSYAAGSKLYNLGPTAGFVSHVYAVRNSQLTVCDIKTNDCTNAANVNNVNIWQPIASNVVGLNAMYGSDADRNGVIEWSTAQPVGAAWADLVAVRMAIVTRSPQYEKTKNGQDVTPNAPVWHADLTGTANANIDVSHLGTDWHHYRYNVSQTIVPLRNMMWGQQ